ncbi:hypothetical protein [Photorhabdus sp. CRCIA-P01]|uniref:hypothetical protein n=1 Tax=Photorhabdus sp. CRCIA-P01 TaxID=2019570 RepID=UPI000E5991EC|nr:hypothetical protein [Photorhabdus sp. CRCIA-P01]
MTDHSKTQAISSVLEMILYDQFCGGHARTARDEAVQIAAVALQIIEYYDRKKRKRPDLSFSNNPIWVGFDPGEEHTS